MRTIQVGFNPTKLSHANTHKYLSLWVSYDFRFSANLPNTSSTCTVFAEANFWRAHYVCVIVRLRALLPRLYMGCVGVGGDVGFGGPKFVQKKRPRHRREDTHEFGRDQPQCVHPAIYRPYIIHSQHYLHGWGWS